MLEKQMVLMIKIMMKTLMKKSMKHQFKTPNYLIMEIMQMQT